MSAALCGAAASSTSRTAPAQVEHDVAVHLDETPIRVVREARVVRAADETAHRLVVQAEVQDGLHHARHRDRSTGAHRDQQGTPKVAELLVGRLLEHDEVAPDLFAELVGEAAVLEIPEAKFGGDGEPRRDGQAEVRHFGEPGTLPTQDIAHGRGAVGAARAERIDEPLVRGHGDGAKR
jgi:hypothetical protein